MKRRLPPNFEKELKKICLNLDILIKKQEKKKKRYASLVNNSKREK